MKQTFDWTSVLDGLSKKCLAFIVERTDFSEPWYDHGFATRMEQSFKEALGRKTAEFDADQKQQLNDLWDRIGRDEK